MFRTIVTLIAAVAALATAALAPLDWIPVLRNNPIGGVLVVFLAVNSAVYIGYVLFNIFSGVSGQGDAGRNPTLYWIDYFPSWIAWLSLNLVLLWVILGVKGYVRGYEEIASWQDILTKYLVLFGLALFSWLDVGILQGHKHKAAWQYIQTQRSIAPAIAVAPPPPAPPAAPPVPPPAPLPVAAPAHVGRGILIVFILLLFAIIAAMFISSTDTGRNMRRSMASADEPSAMCNGTGTSFTETGHGTRVYHTGC